MLNVLLNILLFTGLTEKSLAEFTHLSPFWDDHVPSDEETASLCSFDTVSTGQVSCAPIRHGMARMHQRNITIEMIQRTKKRGQLLLQFLADAETEEMMLEAENEARQWNQKLPSLIESDSIKIHFQEKRPLFRYELEVNSINMSTLEFKKKLLHCGFFDRMRNRLLYFDHQTGIKVVEGKVDGYSCEVNVITVFCVDKGSERSLNFEQPLKLPDLNADREIDIELIPKQYMGYITEREGFVLSEIQRDTKAVVEIFQDERTDDIEFPLPRDHVLCILSGERTCREKAWALIQCISRVSYLGSELALVSKEYQAKSTVAYAAIGKEHKISKMEEWLIMFCNLFRTS